MRQAAGVARSLGVERLLLPVPEESLLGTTRGKVIFLDGLIQAMDRTGEAGLKVWLIAPAIRIMGLNWTPPYLVKGVRDPKAGMVFVDGKVRNLWPFDWWADPSLIQKRIKLFREMVAAVMGHPVLEGWIILDRALEWARPETQAAELVFKSFVSEIRDRNEKSVVHIGLSCSELLDPTLSHVLVEHVDGIRMSGLETPPLALDKTKDLTEEVITATYLGTLANWLFAKPTEVEIGWHDLRRTREPEDFLEACRKMAGSELAGAIWASLVDPEPRLHVRPPWSQRPDLKYVSLLDSNLEPKQYVETLLKEVRQVKPKELSHLFIDISREEYSADPQTHLQRLWDHFRESI
jgi:hypothetical protein